MRERKSATCRALGAGHTSSHEPSSLMRRGRAADTRRLATRLLMTLCNQREKSGRHVR
jgi:hypothetical protein